MIPLMNTMFGRQKQKKIEELPSDGASLNGDADNEGDLELCDGNPEDKV